MDLADLRLWHLLAALGALANALGGAWFAWDKLAARRGWRRTPERRLLLLAAAGPLGAAAAMALTRHKTRQLRFRAVVGAALVAWGAAAAAAWWRWGR